MKIAVCMKQVPQASEGHMDPETGVLIRAGLPTAANVYDLSALEAALLLKDMNNAEITVFTMGPENAESVIRTAFAMGADKGCLICDAAFAGADVLATSYTLMQAVMKMDVYDLVLCGRQTTDGDTAQVSGALAKWLQIPHMNWVTGIESADDGQMTIHYLMEDRSICAKITLPWLLSVEKDAFPPRMPSLKLKISGKKKAVTVLNLKDLEDQNKEHYGLSGSATRVKRIFPPEMTEKRAVTAPDKDEAAEYILKILEAQAEEGL